MTVKQQFNREVRRTAVTTVALSFALLFGITVLAGGDWLPGGIIVVAALVGLARQVPPIRKLRTGPHHSIAVEADRSGRKGGRP